MVLKSTVAGLLKTIRARDLFLESPRIFSGPYASFSSSVSKNGEVCTPETSRFCYGFGGTKRFGTLKKRPQALLKITLPVEVFLKLHFVLLARNLRMFVLTVSVHSYCVCKFTGHTLHENEH